MDRFSYEVVNELNRLRTSPMSYSDDIKKIKSYFKGKVLQIPNSNVGIMTKEGISAYNEAEDFLQKQNFVSKLTPNRALNLIARDYLNEIANQTLENIDNIDIEAIINKYGKFTGTFSRAIDFGGSEPNLVVINLLVSDGDSSRNQRASLFDSNLKLVGVASGNHHNFKRFTVILSCSEFYANNPENNVVDDLYDNSSNLKSINKNVNFSQQQIPMSQQSVNVNNNNNVVDDDDFDLPPGVKSVDKSEKIIIENGRKKKVIKIVKHMEDGSTETEINKESID
jgi:hypothetical protein